MTRQLTSQEPLAGSGDATGNEVFQRLGTLTRTLHDSLRQLGYDRNIENAVQSLPDARSRLAYIARVSGESAEKVLTAVELAGAQQQRLQDQAAEFARKLADHPAAAPVSNAVAHFLIEVDEVTDATRSHLTDIMVAQDFHDRTGQVIARLVAMAQDLEVQLVRLLLEAAPQAHGAGPSNDADVGAAGAARNTIAGGMLGGPVIDAALRPDRLHNQAQVDDLLEQLGF